MNNNVRDISESDNLNERQAFARLGEVLFKSVCIAAARTKYKPTRIRAYGIEWSEMPDAVESLRNLEQFADGLTDLVLDCNYADEDIATVQVAITGVLRRARQLNRLELVFGMTADRTLLDTVLSDLSFPELQVFTLGGCRISLAYLSRFLLQHMPLQAFEEENLILMDGQWSQFFHFARTMLRIPSRWLIGEDGPGPHTHRRGWYIEDVQEAADD